MSEMQKMRQQLFDKLVKLTSEGADDDEISILVDSLRVATSPRNWELYTFII